MSELHDKDGMLKKSVSDKGVDTSNRALGPKGAMGVSAPKVSGLSASNFSADTVMFAFTDEQREYLLARHKASELSDMAYDSEVGGTIISRAMAARKDVEGLRDALNLSHAEDSVKSGVKFSDVIDAKDDAAKSIFMNSGLGDEDAYYDKMREDYMKSISDQIDKESSKSDDLGDKFRSDLADKQAHTVYLQETDTPEGIDRNESTDDMDF